MRHILVHVPTCTSRGSRGRVIVGRAGWVRDAVVNLTVVDCTVRIGIWSSGTHADVHDARFTCSETGGRVGDGLAAKVTTRILFEELLVFYRRARPAMPFHEGKDSHDDGKTASNSHDAESRTYSGFVLEKARGGTNTGSGRGINGKGRAGGGRLGTGKSGRIGVRGIDKRCWIVGFVGYGPGRRTSDTVCRGCEDVRRERRRRR